ncbi:MAG: BatA domain-containing protein [Clostridia bacterium]|nr:BatA domain-containing protein [Clostridia bacterium]
MTFAQPLGLLLLIGIPALIIIFILTSRHQDRGVSSTYIWKLSDRYVKKRLFTHSIKRILLLILEILAITAAAFFVARPSVTHLPNTDYILVFDCSASMQIKDAEGVSRFERAKEDAKKMLDRLSEGHRFSVIAASDDPAVLLDYSSSRDELELCIGAVRPLYGGCDLARTFELVNGVSSETVEPQVVFYTDRPSDVKYPRIDIRDLTNKEINLTALSLKAKSASDGNEFFGKVHSEGYDGSVTTVLKVDGKIVDALDVEVTAGQTAEFSFPEKVGSYKTAELIIRGEDGLEEDNSFVLCKKNVRRRTVLLAGLTPFYLFSSLNMVDGLSVQMAFTLDKTELTGKDVYVFDGVAPETLPRDGSLIFFGVSVPSLNLELGDVRGQETVILRDPDAAVPFCLDFSDKDEPTVVAEYKPLDAGALWQTVLTCDGEPVMAVRSLDNGRKAVAFSFDLHDTNLPLQVKFLNMISELVEYTAPSVIRKTDYSFGEEVTVHAQGSGTVYVDTPAGNVRFIELRDAEGTFIPDRLGVYSVTAPNGMEEGEAASFYLHIPPEETEKEEYTGLPEVFVPEGTEQVREATREITFWLIVAMLVLLLLEWGLYIYEQY